MSALSLKDNEISKPNLPDWNIVFDAMREQVTKIENTKLKNIFDVAVETFIDRFQMRIFPLYNKLENEFDLAKSPESLAFSIMRRHEFKKLHQRALDLIHEVNECLNSNDSQIKKGTLVNIFWSQVEDIVYTLRILLKKSDNEDTRPTQT